MPAGRVRPKHFPEGIFISFVALAINIATTIVGVVAPDDARIAKLVVYYVLLAVCLFIFIIHLSVKYCFLHCTQNIKPRCANSRCLKSMVYDLAFCTMALLYLTGDNLPHHVCEDNCGLCPTIGHAFTGVSLVINIALSVLRAGDLKPKLPSAIPVIGKMGNVYSKLLQMAAAALTIDLTFTSILEPLDIQNYKCNVTVDANTVKHTAIGVMTVLCAIVLLLIVVGFGLLACANSVCCDYKRKEVKWKEVCGQWSCAVVVMGFVILFIAGDVDWFWNILISENDRAILTWPMPKIIRMVFLCLSLLALTILMLTYFFVICLPGLIVALRDEGFFLPKQAGSGLTVVQHMVRKRYNAWDTNGTAEVRHHRDCELKGKFKVKDEFNKAEITLDVTEETKCWEAFSQLYRRFNDWKCMEGDDNDETDWTVETYIGRRMPDEEMVDNSREETTIDDNHGANVNMDTAEVNATSTSVPPSKGDNHGENVNINKAEVNAPSTFVPPSKGDNPDMNVKMIKAKVKASASVPTTEWNRGIEMHATLTVQNTAS